MKLEELLGAELYAQVQAKIDEANSGQEDKLKHIRYADLSEGEYVARGKHDALQTKFDSQSQELESANSLIAELKKASKDNEDVQGKITEYESRVEQLQAELNKARLDSAIKVGLLSAKAEDIDYLTFKLNENLKEKGEKLELDDNGQIKGWDDKLKGLKTQFSKMFASAGNGNNGYAPIGTDPLPQGSQKTVTKEQFRAMGYEERLKLKESNLELFKQLNN